MRRCGWPSRATRPPRCRTPACWSTATHNITRDTAAPEPTAPDETAPDERGEDPTVQTDVPVAEEAVPAVVAPAEPRAGRRLARGGIRRRNTPNDGPITGVAKVDRRTKALVKRLGPGDIAVINHEDLDRVAAETLVDAAPLAVINAAASI